MTIDEMREVLGELADELPEGFFRNLNGGIIVSPAVKYHPRGVEAGKTLYIMAEYTSGGHMGRQIVVYHGSFERVYGHLPREAYKDRLRSTLRHEFRHHVEGLSNLMDLEVEDKIQINRFLNEDQGE